MLEAKRFATRRTSTEVHRSSLGLKPLWLLLPAMASLLLVQVYPTLYSFYLSFGRLKAGNYSFVGLRNYLFLFRTEDFYQSLGLTAVYAGSYVVLSMGLGMLLALLFNRRGKLTPLYMTCIFVPYVISDVVAGTMWNWMFQQSYGLVQVALNPLLNGMSVLSRPGGAMAIVIAASVWKHLAFNALLFLGALQVVSQELYEAAALDGATRWKSFTSITLPIIQPTLLVALLLTSLRGINALGMILATTQGGPGTATMTTSVYLYRNGWMFGDFGTAAAISVLMLVINILLAIIYVRVLRRA